MGHLVQMAGLAVQNFVSAAVGLAVAIALVRGFARSRTERARATSGSTWSAARCGSCCRWRSSRRSSWCWVAWCRTSPARRRSPPSPAARRTSSAARSPLRRRSRSSAPTAAASSTPTARTRSRTRLGVDQPVRDLPAAGDPVQPAAHLRPHGRRQAPGPARSSRVMAGSVGRRGRGRRPGRRCSGFGSVPAGRRCGDGGQGGPVRARRVRAVRRLDHGHVHRLGQQLPRLVHAASAGA